MGSSSLFSGEQAAEAPPPGHAGLCRVGGGVPSPVWGPLSSGEGWEGLPGLWRRARTGRPDPGQESLPRPQWSRHRERVEPGLWRVW